MRREYLLLLLVNVIASVVLLVHTGCCHLQFARERQSHGKGLLMSGREVVRRKDSPTILAESWLKILVSSIAYRELSLRPLHPQDVEGVDCWSTSLETMQFDDGLRHSNMVNFQE